MGWVQESRLLLSRVSQSSSDFFFHSSTSAPTASIHGTPCTRQTLPARLLPSLSPSSLRKEKGPLRRTSTGIDVFHTIATALRRPSTSLSRQREKNHDRNRERRKIENEEGPRRRIKRPQRQKEGREAFTLKRPGKKRGERGRRGHQGKREKAGDSSRLKCTLCQS